jgi:hypothetical protein
MASQTRSFYEFKSGAVCYVLQVEEQIVIERMNTHGLSLSMVFMAGDS